MQIIHTAFIMTVSIIFPHFSLFIIFFRCLLTCSKKSSATSYFSCQYWTLEKIYFDLNIHMYIFTYKCQRNVRKNLIFRTEDENRKNCGIDKCSLRKKGHQNVFWPKISFWNFFKTYCKNYWRSQTISLFFALSKITFNEVFLIFLSWKN